MRLALVITVVGAMAFAVADGQQAPDDGPPAAERQASGVTVPPLPVPAIPEGSTGIAARYPGDVGIEKDADVVFVESFEGSVDEICGHWEAAAGKPMAALVHRHDRGTLRQGFDQIVEVVNQKMNLRFTTDPVDHRVHLLPPFPRFLRRNRTGACKGSAPDFWKSPVLSNQLCGRVFFGS